MRRAKPVSLLAGFILLGFLLGELTNTMTNLDPVGNKFKQTRDSLTEFMSKHQFSSSLRRKLKEYITLSEPIFRENHYAQILTKLSPRFKHIVANNVSGYLVTQIPFIRYATQHVAGVKEGSTLWVEYDGVTRKCRVVMIPDYLCYDVLYLDNGQREYGVPHHRVDVARTIETDGDRERIFRLIYEQDSLVVRIAHHFEAQLYMGRDTVVLRDMSVNDALYVVEVGNVMVFGASSARQFHCVHKKGTQYFGDDVSMLLCGSKKPQLVHYSVKTTEVTQLKVLPGKVLVDILTKTPSFNLHHAQIRRYGCWLLLKASLIRHIRDRCHDDQPALATMVTQLLGKSFDARLKHDTPGKLSPVSPPVEVRTTLKLDTTGDPTSAPVCVHSSVGAVPSLAQAAGSARARAGDRAVAIRGGRATPLGATSTAPTKAAIAAAMHEHHTQEDRPSDDRVFKFLLKHFAHRAAANAKERADGAAWEVANPLYTRLCRALYDSLQESGSYADKDFVRPPAHRPSPESSGSDTESDGGGAIVPGHEEDEDDGGA